MIFSEGIECLIYYEWGWGGWFRVGSVSKHATPAAKAAVDLWNLWRG